MYNKRNGMSFHFIYLTLSKPRQFLTMVDRDGKPRFVTFKEEHSAVSAMRYLANFKSKHGKWPTMDMSATNLTRINRDERVRQDFGVSMSLMGIESCDEDALRGMAMRCNTSFLWVHNFEVLPPKFGGTVEQIAFKGSEIDAIIDNELYVQNLETLVL